MEAIFSVTPTTSQPDQIAGLARIAEAFDRSRFEALALSWPGGTLRLSKGGSAIVPTAPSEVIPAPRVGIFRTDGLKPSPRSQVAAGEILGSIDVLGERHPVKSPKAGTLTECCVSEGIFVEYGAPLFRIAL